jgi:hypothetical protein
MFITLIFNSSINILITQKPFLHDISMVKYASQWHLLFFWKVPISYALIYWIHEYYLS